MLTTAYLLECHDTQTGETWVDILSEEQPTLNNGSTEYTPIMQATGESFHLAVQHLTDRMQAECPHLYKRYVEVRQRAVKALSVLYPPQVRALVAKLCEADAMICFLCRRLHPRHECTSCADRESRQTVLKPFRDLYGMDDPPTAAPSCEDPGLGKIARAVCELQVKTTSVNAELGRLRIQLDRMLTRLKTLETKDDAAHDHR